MRKIALVGTSSSGDKAPYHDPSWRIWGVSARADYVVRADRWFELHRLDGEPEQWANDWRQALKGFTHDLELVMMYPEPDLGPNVTQYPYQHIVDRFGTYFMQSTFSWMMALAIDELRPESGDPVEGQIGIWGVEMEAGTEYSQQRSGFRHFIEVAKLLGIPVVRLASGGLAYEPIPYPMWQDDPLLEKVGLRNRQTQDHLRVRDKTITQTRTMIAQNVAVSAELDAMKKKGYSRAKRRQELAQEYTALMETSSNVSREIVEAEAANEEQRWLLDYLQP